VFDHAVLTLGRKQYREDWNDLVDLYYDRRGWDRETGWPTRETYEKYGLGDVAEALDAIGKLPR
jgi:aldehyde:ferredoxin oxidoreductase